MNKLWLLLAVAPLFALLMLLEAGVGRLLGKRLYGWRQTLNNLASVAGYVAVQATLGLGPFLGYAWIEERLGLFEWSPAHPLAWVGALLILDFLLYWRHRLGHDVAALWALHAIHHQSTDYNASVAIRTSWFHDGVLVTFPLALLGVPMEMVLPLYVGALLYQYVQHTQLIPKLGFVEGWLMTPAGHRVHHARNPQYLDKNHGYVLAIWDRLFGTWEPEGEAPEYGTVDGTDTYDALGNILGPISRLAVKVRAMPTLSLKVQALVRRPGWWPAALPRPVVVRRSPPRWRDPGLVARVSAGLLTAQALFVGACVLAWSAVVPLWVSGVLTLGVLGSLVLTGILLDGGLSTRKARAAVKRIRDRAA